MQGIPGAQVVERIQKQIAETIPQERDQRTVEQNVCMSVPLAAPRAATVAPVDVYTKPAPVIDLMPTPVIEYIAPSAAVSYPSFFPSFDQIHEAVTDMSVPTVRQQRNVQEIPGTQVVERIQKQIVETVPQERDQRTVEQNACLSVPTVQEQMIVQGIPELQDVEQKLEQTVEAMQVKLLERVQRRAVEQSKRLFERLEEFHKRLEMSEARRAENNELIKEIGVLWEEKKRQEWRNLNRSVQVMEQIPEHPVMSSDQEG